MRRVGVVMGGVGVVMRRVGVVMRRVGVVINEPSLIQCPIEAGASLQSS